MLNLNKTFFKLVSVLLIFSLVFNVIAVSASEIAPTVKFNPKKVSLNANVGELPNRPSSAKVELKSKRTSYSTRYLNPDGSFTEEIFLEPKYYKDSADKQWKEIDNNLKASVKKAGKFENSSNGFKTLFADKTNNEELVAIEKNGKSIAFIPVNSNKVNGKVQKNSIIYKDIYPNIDINYTVAGTKLKEDIIMNSFTGQNIFSYEIKLKGLDVLEDESGIYFEDNKGQKLWCVEKPYMIDAEGKYSDKVELVLTKDNGKAYIDVVADKDFLEDSNTIYPVVIDPTINDYDVIRDTFVASLFPSTSYSSLTKMYTGSDPYYYGTMRSMTQFTLPSLPSDSKILSAYFNAYQTQVDSTTVSVDLYRITSSWTGSATWNTQPSIGTSAESTVTSNTNGTYWQWNITQLSKDWYNGVQSNYGIMLKQQNEATSPFRAFNTVNTGTNTPKLTINYWVDPIGTEDFWSCTEDGVNPANGNLIHQANDVSITGIGIPINVTRTYNSRKATVAGMFGYGWRSNVEAQLVDAGQGPITLIDGDGTRHIFGEKIGGGYEAHGGIYLDLVKNGYSTYTITQIDGTKTNFNTSGKISTIVDMNGNTTTFSYTSGKLTSIADASSRSITINYGANGYVSSIDMPSSRTISYNYDANYNLTKVTDPESKEVDLGYDTSHNLTTITDQRDITTTITYSSGSVESISRPITIDSSQVTSTSNYTYDFNLSVTTVTDGEGNRVDYLYNPNKNIVQITENPLDSQNKAVTSFEYDNNNNLVKITDANTNEASGTEAYIFTYDSNGNVTGVQLPEGQSSTTDYDTNNNPVNDTDYNGNESTNIYDSKNNHFETVDPYLQATASRFHTNGNIEYETKSITAADNLAPNSSFEYGTSFADNWTQAVESGKTATFNWSSTAKFGNKSVSITDPTGWAIVYSDKVNHTTGTNYVVSGYVKTANTTGTAIIKLEFFDSSDNWIGQQSGYALKGIHDWTRIHAVIDDVPSGTAKIRAAVGLNAGTGTVYFDGVQLEKANVVSSYNFVDNAGFERDTDSNDMPDNWTDSGNLSANDIIYTRATADDDKVYAGNNSFKITGESGKNKYIKQTINILGDVNTKLTLSGWSKQEGASIGGGYYLVQLKINYTDQTADWSNSNDFDKSKDGWQHAAVEINPIKAFDSIEVYYYYYNQTGTAYFDAMRLEEGSSFVSYYYDSNNYVNSIADPLENEVSFVNDSYGNKTSVTDGKDNTTFYVYDKRNLLTKVTDTKNNITQYSYDNAGNRTTVTNARNKVTTYAYNEFNKISSITNPLSQVTELEYDKNGNVEKIIYPEDDVISYAYNDLNRLDGTYYNGDKQWAYAYDANGNITTVTEVATSTDTDYTYDKNSRLTKIEEGSSNSIDYVYDDNSNLTSMTITAGSTSVTNGNAYNALDQVAGITRNSTSLEKFAYDEQGNVVSITRTNGTYTSFEYDDVNRLKRLTNFNASGAVESYYGYTYDANGNRTSVDTESGSISYQYDDLNQLTQETLLDSTTIDYEYDAVGNRTKKTVTNGGSTVTNYTYNDGNELTAVDSQSYTYDDNGNLTSNGDKTYIYNEENRLVEVKNYSNQTIATFTYDHEGKRNSMTTTSGTVYYHYSGDKVVYETDGSNNITAEYTYDSNGNPATMTVSGTTYYYHVNGHGDVMKLTDGSGNVVAQYNYDVWGNILSQSGTMASTNPIRYAGYRYEEVTGLYYLMARYYDAEIGRFITRDSFHGTEDEPLSLNQYAYCNNNPVMYIDPSGNIRVRVYWWGVKLTFTGRETQGLIWALGIGSGASWLAAEISSPTIIGGISFGVLAASLALCTGIIGFVNWKNHGKGFTYRIYWNGFGVIW